MAQQALTETPVNLLDALSLSAGTKYLVQAVTSKPAAGDNWTDTPVYLAAAAAASPPSQPDQILNHWDRLVIDPTSATPPWAWCPVGRKLGTLLVSEAAT